MKISVIIPHYYRAALLEKTLIQYAAFGGLPISEVEFIIVDDSGNQDAEFWKVIERMCRMLDIKPFSIDEGTRNPILPLNFGIRQAQGEFILITQPECVPITLDCLAKIYERMNDKTYLSCSCYSMSEVNAAQFVVRDWDFKFENRAATFDGDDGWYQHGQFNNRNLPFCACIPRQAIVDIGGYDEDLTGTVYYDDDDIRDRLFRYGLAPVNADDIICLHLWHYAKKWHMEGGEERARALYLSKKDGPIERNVGREWGTPKKGIWGPHGLV